MTKKLYISQPIFGAPVEFSNGVKRHISRKLRSTDYKVMDFDLSKFKDNKSKNRELLKALINADLVIFTSDWKASPKCVFERNICVECGIDFIDI